MFDLDLYEIAYNLGLPLYKLIEEMPYLELKGWIEFFKKRPVGWREDNRTALLMRAFGVKEKPEIIFPSLAALKENAPKTVGLRGSKMLQMMLSAKGGQKLEL